MKKDNYIDWSYLCLSTKSLYDNYENQINVVNGLIDRKNQIENSLKFENELLNINFSDKVKISKSSFDRDRRELNDINLTLKIEIKKLKFYYEQFFENINILKEA
jgi:hypothetical protein